MQAVKLQEERRRRQSSPEANRLASIRSRLSGKGRGDRFPPAQQEGGFPKGKKKKKMGHPEEIANKAMCAQVGAADAEGPRPRR